MSGNSSSAVCEKCEQDKVKSKAYEGGVNDGSGCDVQYSSVVACMKLNRGNISDCKAEWDDFSACRKKYASRSSSS
jgi:hypothetical protein